MHIVTHSMQETQNFAGTIAGHIRTLMSSRTTALVIALRGDLGAGKTTFTQGLAHALGVAQTPKSPTFLLAKEYPITGTTWSLWHLDCYRLTGHQDLITMDLHRIFQEPTNIIVVEWPENISDGLPRDHVEIHFTHQGGDARSITVNGL